MYTLHPVRIYTYSCVVHITPCRNIYIQLSGTRYTMLKYVYSCQVHIKLCKNMNTVNWYTLNPVGICIQLSE